MATSTDAEQIPESGGEQQRNDEALLEKMGYKQELSRSLGFFSSFGIQFSSIAIASSTFTTFIVGLSFFGPASFWSYVIGGAFQVFTVGLAVAKLVSAYPLAGGVYQITGRITGKPWLAWQTGWLLVIAHTVSVTAVSTSMVPFLAGWFGVTVDSNRETVAWAAGIMVFVTLFNIAGVKVAALLNNVGVIAEIVVVVLLIGGLILIKHPTQPLSILTNTGGTTSGGHWLSPALFAMILPAYLISSFDATGNASEETKNANKMAPLASVVANTSAYVTGGIIIGLLLMAIQEPPRHHGQLRPRQGHPRQRHRTDLRHRDRSGRHRRTAGHYRHAAAHRHPSAVVTGSRRSDAGGSLDAQGQPPTDPDQRHPHGPRPGPAIWPVVLVAVGARGDDSAGLGTGLRVVVTVGFWPVIKKKLPEHPWHYGKFSPVIFVVAIIWSFVLCIVLVVSDPIHVGLGLVGVVVAGCIIYQCIPKSRRGISRDVAPGHL